MKPQEAYRWLLDFSRETTYLDSARSLLVWDQRTVIPERGHAHRANQLAVLAGMLHARATDPRVGENLAVIEGSEMLHDPLSPEAVNVREWRRHYGRATRIPERLAVELARKTSEGQAAWQKARPLNDWDGFKPHLERILRLKIEEAEHLGFENEPYDALLDGYEPGETAEGLSPILSGLRDPLLALLRRIADSGREPDRSLVHSSFPIAEQELFARVVLQKIGYDFGAGRLDLTAHPFTVGIGPGDVRITTRYDDSSLGPGLFGAIHEAGHALYHAGLPENHWGSPLGEHVSLGIHESQSRLWENMVARSRGFWEFFYPEARKHFPSLTGVPLDAFHFAVNEVRPGFIRTKADEVTYNLHILLRFDLERDLLQGSLGVDELPEAWNEKMENCLGISPPDNADGVMQDIHWSAGAFGYFPTYALGNIYAAQFYAQAERELGDLQVLFIKGDLAPLLHWLRRNIHSEGCRFRPRDLLRKVTGEVPNPRFLLDYLENKYSTLYGFSPKAH